MSKLRSSVLALLASAAMGCDDEWLCPDAYVTSSFSLILERAEWTPANYQVELRYPAGKREVKHTCEVRVPVLSLTGEDDAGQSIVFDLENDLNPDSGTPEDASFIECTSSPTAARSKLRALIGRSLIISVDETPQTVQLTVSDSGEPVLDQELDLAYTTTHPLGEECRSTDTATAAVTLP
jgi:hypothetical protein